MKKSIETNKNENQNNDLIFVSGGVKRLDGSKSSNSENYIIIKMSDLETLGINCQSQCNIFKQTEKNGNFIADGNPCFLVEKYHEVKLEFAYPDSSDSSKDHEILDKNCFEVMCNSGKNIYRLRLCFTERNSKKKLDKYVSLDDPDLVWLELVCDKDGDKFLTKYNRQNKIWEPTNISFGLRDSYGGNDVDSKGKNTVWEMCPKKTKFLTRFISKDRITIKENEAQSIISKIETDTELKIDNVSVYICMQFKPNGPFYFAQKEESVLEVLDGKTAIINNFNERVEDVLVLRFYFTDQKLSVNKGNQFDNQLIKNAKKSVFEIRRDKNWNIVLWHYDLNKKICLPVDAKVKRKTAVDSATFHIFSVVPSICNHSLLCKALRA